MQLDVLALLHGTGVSFFKFQVIQPCVKSGASKSRERAINGTDRRSTALRARNTLRKTFEPRTAIAARMGLSKRKRLKPDAIPTVFERQQPPSSGEPSSSGERGRKRSAATALSGTCEAESRTLGKKPRQAYAKRERSRVRNNK